MDTSQFTMPLPIQISLKTRKLFAVFGCVSAFDVLGDLRMAFAAGVIGDLPIVRFDLDRFMETPRRERKRMPEAIRGFRCVLREKTGGRVAVVAGRNDAVRRFQPPVVLRLHNVAVGDGY